MEKVSKCVLDPFLCFTWSYFGVIEDKFVHAKGHVCLVRPRGGGMSLFDYSINMENIILILST